MMGETAGEEPGANTHGQSRTYTQKFYSALQLLVVDVCILQAFEYLRRRHRMATMHIYRRAEP